MNRLRRPEEGRDTWDADPEVAKARAHLAQMVAAGKMPSGGNATGANNDFPELWKKVAVAFEQAPCVFG